MVSEEAAVSASGSASSVSAAVSAASLASAKQTGGSGTRTGLIVTGLMVAATSLSTWAVTCSGQKLERGREGVREGEEFRDTIWKSTLNSAKGYIHFHCDNLEGSGDGNMDEMCRMQT